MDCFETVLDPQARSEGDILSRLFELTAASAAGDLRLMDPSQVLFGAGAGWISPAYVLPRAARFSSSRHGAFYVAEEIATGVEEVRHHLELDLRRERITAAMDLDYRALAVQVQGRFHDIRGKARTRAPWSAICAPESHAFAQAFAESLRAIDAKGIAYASVRRPGGSCLAIFDPNTLGACRHDTYLGFRWDGHAVSRVVEQRLLALQGR
jgi:hypothetical protein